MKDRILLIIKNVWSDIKNIKWAIFVIAVYWVIANFLFGQFCPMRIMTGLPCPGCGATRAGLMVLSLRWKEAMEMNPTVFLWIPYILFLFYQRYVGKKQPKLSNILLVIIGVVVLLWYVVGMALYFPNKEPFTFFDGNILQKCYPIPDKTLFVK